MAPKLKVLLTGATGRVGSILRREWGDRFELRLADIRELGDTSLSFRGVDEADGARQGPDAPRRGHAGTVTTDVTHAIGDVFLGAVCPENAP